MRILLVEDSERLRKSLCMALKKSGYVVDSAADGEEGLWQATSNPYDVIILDIMLPKKDGLTVLGELRQKGQSVHVLLLTAKDTVADRVHGLRSGADDYLVKPFALDELLARVEALCRRAYGEKDSILSVGSLEIDVLARRARRAGVAIELTPREYLLLEYLARRKGQVVSRSDIESHIYDDQVDPMSNVVDSAICAIRRKLSEHGDEALIHTRRGMGYVLERPAGLA